MSASTSGRSIFGLSTLPRSPPVQVATSTSHALGDVSGHGRGALARLVVGVRVHRHETQLLSHRRTPSTWPRPAGPVSAAKMDSAILADPTDNKRTRGRQVSETRATTTRSSSRRAATAAGATAAAGRAVPIILLALVVVAARCCSRSGSTTSTGRPTTRRRSSAGTTPTDTRMTIQFTVRVPAGRPAACVLRARDYGGTEVGRRDGRRASGRRAPPRSRPRSRCRPRRRGFGGRGAGLSTGRLTLCTRPRAAIVQDRAIQAACTPLVSLVIRSVQQCQWCLNIPRSSKEIDRVQFRGAEDLAFAGRLRPAAGRARRVDRRPARGRRGDQRPPRGGRPPGERRLPRRPRGAGQAGGPDPVPQGVPAQRRGRRGADRRRGRARARSSRSTSTTTRPTPRRSCSARARSRRPPT